MVKTFQRADIKTYGTMAKIIPMTNEVGENILSKLIKLEILLQEVTNKIDCFGVDGGEGMQIEAQSMLPDISDFELLGEELKGGQNCQKWQKVQKVDELNPGEHQPTYMLLPDW